jgi:predicted XRE-type DNA-binding protein
MNAFKATLPSTQPGRRQLMNKGGTGMSTVIIRSSGNVYADLGIRNADEHPLKAKLVRQIAAVLEEQELTQSAAARRLGIAQPDVSRMLRGHFRQFSVERLMRFLVALGHDVEIVVRPVSATRAKAARLTTSPLTISRGQTRRV